jgi:carbonic anhydrase
MALRDWITPPFDGEEKLLPSDAVRIWAGLMEGNRRFIAGAPQARDLVRERQSLALAQHPKAVVLACSDSRVAPEIIFDQPLGEMFVIRVAGNTVDALALGSLEYAAEQLNTPLLIVLGHLGCGAVKAACSDEKAASPNLKVLVRTVRKSFAAPVGGDGDMPHEERLRRAEKENARFVSRELLDRSALLHRRVQQGELAVIAAYYRLDSGEVERL